MYGNWSLSLDVAVVLVDAQRTGGCELVFRQDALIL